jgi:hypothetical protein
MLRHFCCAVLTTALAAPAVFAQPAPAAEAPADAAVDCTALDVALQRTEQARRAAQDDSDNAWKAVVPFVVLARKASAKSALDDADRQLAALKVQRAACPPFI